MNSGKQADIILKQQPAENAPYLTKAGIAAFILILLCIIAAVTCWNFEIEDASRLLAAAVAAAFFFVSADYAAAILAWRVLKKGGASPAIDIARQTLSENTESPLNLTLCNPLKIPIYLKAVRWAHSENIQISSETDQLTELAPHKNSTFAFKLGTTHAGKSYIQGLGMLITSPMGLFFAEEHILLQHPIKVVPAACALPRTTAVAGTLPGKASNRMRTFESDAELEFTRPYQNSDNAHHIAWRYYAKTQDLQVWQFSKNADKSLVCLLDAGPQMRLHRPDNTSNLTTAINRILCTAGAYNDITIIAYDENTAVYAADQIPPQKLQTVMTQWLLDELEWRPPSRLNKDHALIWNLAASQLHQDFKLYRHVDFSTQTKGGRKINLKSLVDWAKSDRFVKARQDNEKQTALEYLKMPYAELLTTLVRERCRLPQSQLMPNPPEAKLRKAAKLLEKRAKTKEISLLWISDFASPASESSLQMLSKILKKGHIPSQGLCMPMPTHALNFNASHGIQRRRSLTQFFGKDIRFIEDESGTKTGEAVSAKSR